MKICKYLCLFVPLFFFVACHDPYKKPVKKPMKIGLAAERLAQAEAKKAEESKAENADVKPIEETETLDNKGVGAIKDVEIGDGIDKAMAEAGKETFSSLCVACHQMDKRMVGPALGGITKVRAPEWIMNMILDPDKMLSEDPVAKKLLEKYGAPMANMGLDEKQAREVLEYFRSYDEK